LVPGLRRGASEVLAPVRDAADDVVGPVGDAVSGVTGYRALEDENAELRRRIEDLEGERLRDEGAAAELEALLEVDGLDRFTTLASVAARVVSTPVSNFEQTVQLDRGSDHGVGEDMPVVTGAGLVGRVVEVTRTRSTVRLITDPSSSVGVRLSGSGDLGVAEGTGPDRPLDVGLVDPATSVAEQELVVTSGVDDSFYPGGIPVGRTTGATSVEGELEQEVALEPVVDLRRLRFVRVLQPATT
jgi:rod shape-determining protein MreC